jgi:hypothetical protein
MRRAVDTIGSTILAAMNRKPSADIVHLGDARPPVSNKR